MTPDRVDAIYKEIEGYSIQLAADPTAAGPRYLQDLIATCRNYINAVSRILLEVHREKHLLTHQLGGEETLYEVESTNLLANDERVKRGASFGDRKALADSVLRKRLNTIAELKEKLQDLDYVEKAVRLRHRELRDTMAEIKLQRSLMRDELDTSAFYGDERTDQPRGDDDLSPEEIEKLLEDTPAEEPGNSVEIQPARESSEAIQEFLGDSKAIDESAPEEEDYSDILNDL